MPEPLVSILIPCFNASPWVEQAIQSALDQTYPNLEVIVADDGSTDGSAQKIEAFGDSISFLRLSHAGGNATRNRLTQAARGEWLQYLDADDYLLPHKIASQMSFASSAGSGLDVVYSPVLLQDADVGGEPRELPIETDDEVLTFIQWAPLNTGGLLFRRTAVLDVGGWKEDQPCCQEHELLLRLIRSKKRFGLARKAGIVYRRHGSVSVSRRDPLRVIRMRMQLSDNMEAHLEATGGNCETYQRAFYVARLESARAAWHFDRGFAEELYAKALKSGHWWVPVSSALPSHYQVACRIAGFRNAEIIADWVRDRKPVRQSSAANA